jgi:hypothetical protein
LCNPCNTLLPLLLHSFLTWLAACCGPPTNTPDPQIEQSVKLCRFLACTAAGTAATAAGSSGSAAAAAAPEELALKSQLKAEVEAAVGFILDNIAGLSLMEDRAIALAEAAQVCVTCVSDDTKVRHKGVKLIH